MKHIDERRLESDLNYRFGYVSEFMGFSEADVAAIHASAGALAPLVPTLVDAVYQQLQKYDSTWRHFLPRQTGYEGPVPTTLDELTDDHPMIRYRKEHLSYLAALVTRPYDDKTVAYLNMVGQIHTAKGGSPKIVVPLVQMNALLGFVADALTGTIMTLGLDREKEVQTLRAFGKLLWLQNDLINRHYQASAGPAGAGRAA